MADIVLVRKNNSNTHYTVYSESPAILQELSEFFTFESPNAKWNQKKHWDGKIRLFSTKTHQLYIGLADHVRAFAHERNYQVEIDEPPAEKCPSIENILKAAKLPSSVSLTEDRHYQIESVEYALKNKRCLILSPTGSGKSLSIYLILIGLLLSGKKKGLVIVPTVSLVNQLYSDFSDYARENSHINIEKMCHKIYSGMDKVSDKAITISTWQSLFEMDKKYFSQYEFIIGDEAHTFQAKSLTSIMSKLVNCDVRIGTSGTLQDTKVHKLSLQGMFGRIKKVITTKELMDRKILADLQIKCLVIKHPKEHCDFVRKQSKLVGYEAEISYIRSCEERNKSIAKLAESLSGNTLILYQFVQKHGDRLYEIISGMSNKDIHYVNGQTEAEIREEIRSVVENSTNSIIVASYGTFSTGINIKNLNNIIFASPSRSKIRVLQSIGRALRTTQTKKTALLFDIVDDMRVDAWENAGIKQFQERIRLYSNEKFKYTISKFDIWR